jgi:hypothetical protein
VDSLLSDIVSLIAGSSLQETVIRLLRSVPGLPPIVQSVHIVGIVVIVATFMMLHLRVLGVAAQGQTYPEMWQRLRPWAWSALAVLLISGAVFVIARPGRYFVNPVFGIKFALLFSALTCSLFMARLVSVLPAAPRYSLPLKLVSVIGVMLWVGVILAGRWIAYADYLFWEV